MKSNFKHILIYGLGLMGASLALALKKKGYAGKITGLVRNETSKSKGIEKKITDEIFLESDFLRNPDWDSYDLIIFSLPVDLTVEKIDLIPDSYRGIITDLGSTKSEIIQKVESKFRNAHNYISSHPMAGSEETGLQYANEDLYETRLCILTCPEKANPEAIVELQEFWQNIGSVTTTINAIDHDEILAYLSHAPHILASLLASWANANPKVNSYTKNSPIPLTGGGFRDMTRIAGSNPQMWEAIINTNRKAIHKSLLEFKDSLNELIDLVNPEKKEEPEKWQIIFQNAKKDRNTILKIQ